MMSTVPVVSNASSAVVDELLDERAQVGDDPRRERLLHEPPQPGVVGRVGVEHRLGRWPPGPAQHLLDAIVEEIVVERDADRRIPQHPVDVVVAQEQPGAERRLLDRVLGADRRVDRIGIDEEIGTEQFVRSDHRGNRTVRSRRSCGALWARQIRPWI